MHTAAYDSLRSEDGDLAGADQPRIGRAEPLEHHVRPEVPAEAVPPARHRREPRLRDRPVPDREDGICPRAADPRRAWRSAGRGSSRRRWRCCSRWCRNQGQGWEYMLGVLGRYFEQVASEQHRLERIETPPGRAVRPGEHGASPGRLRGRRRRAPLGGRARHADRRDAPGPGERPDRPGLRPRAPHHRGTGRRWPAASAISPARRLRCCGRSSPALGERRPGAWPTGFSTRDRRSSCAWSGLRQAPEQPDQDPGPRRLSPRPGPLGRERFRDPRLRGRARPVDGRSPRQEVAPARRRRHAPLVRLRRLQRAR